MHNTTLDRLAVPTNNILDGRIYETVSLQVTPDDLLPGDVISTGTGAYQVSSVGRWDMETHEYIRHIRISHTLFGPVMGGLLRGAPEYVHVVARRRAEG